MLSHSSNSERSTILSKIKMPHGRNRSTTFVPKNLIYSNQEKTFARKEASTKLTSNQIALRANNQKDSKDKHVKLHIQIKKENDGTKLHLLNEPESKRHDKNVSASHSTPKNSDRNQSSA